MVDSSNPGFVAVVDDDAAVRDALRFLLEAAGHGVCAYESVAGFLANPPSGRLRGLIVAHTKRGQTGLEFLERQRANGATPPFVLLTAEPPAHIRRRAAELGATSVLEKSAV